MSFFEIHAIALLIILGLMTLLCWVTKEYVEKNSSFIPWFLLKKG